MILTIAREEQDKTLKTINKNANVHRAIYMSSEKEYYRRTVSAEPGQARNTSRRKGLAGKPQGQSEILHRESQGPKGIHGDLTDWWVSQGMRQNITERERV